MCSSEAEILLCGSVVIPIWLAARHAKCGEFELCFFSHPEHPDGDRYLCKKCASERGISFELDELFKQVG